MAQTQYTNTLPLDSMLMEYKLVSILGVGGFGITYLARDTHLEKDVAIKEYFPASDVTRVENGTVTLTNTQRTEDYQTGLDRFLKEARTLAGFSHPHIVRVNRYFKAHGTGYMVMDYEDGESLKTWLEKNPFPPEETIKSLLALLLDGIGKVHAAGFLHRDIKPDNIFMRADGKPVLIDFGSARHAIGGVERTLTTLVTPGYAPFEQYTSKSEQGPWSDIYALGGVLFYAVTGENPPDALTRMKVDTVADALARAHERYSGPFLDAIAWALEPDERKRPQTVAEWRRRILGDLAEEAAPAPDFLVDEFGAETPAKTGPAAGPATMKAPPTAPPTAPATARPAGPTDSPDTQDISRFLEQREELDRAVKAKFQRVLTVMFTDLKGSTAIAETSGDIAVRAMLKRYHDLCLIAVKRHGGTLVKTIGDGSLSHFEGADAACRAACDIQRGMEEINLAKTYKTLLLARIGIHTGECILEKNDIFGDVVNTASRFESSAHPGEIFVSEDTYNALPDKSEFYARFDREVTLKGKSMPFKGYIVFWDPKEVELDKARPREAVAEKRATPAWKLALYVVVPILAILVAAIWITGGDKFAGESRRTIEHSIPAK
ncbi:MAG: protein kinase [Betaproteobacteria bacterium]|nr:protein kinase [Betaproteobacteria bacterium]